MAEADLEQLLKDLPRLGTRICDEGRREIWRFERAGRPYLLTFYPSGGSLDRLRRRIRGSPALREFHALQHLQKAGIPAVRAVALLMGFVLDGRRGDAVITEALEPSVPLDRHLAEGQVDHRRLAGQLVALLESLGRARLGHGDLRPHSFLLHNDTLYLADALALRQGGLSSRDIYRLAFNLQPYATRTDRQRAWQRLCPDSLPPRRNPLAWGNWWRLRSMIFGENRIFGRLRLGEWSGHFFKQISTPHPGSPASRLNITREDWDRAWPVIERRMAAGEFEILKHGKSGDVLGGTVELGGRAVDIIIKHPRRRYWWRYFNEIGRGSRSRRAWKKAWHLIARGVPTAWPLLYVERRRFGYPVEALTINERISGHTLDSVDWAGTDPSRYHLLLRRCGRLLRQIEDGYLFLYDAKATNWMVREDPVLGPVPMLIDVDGVRFVRQPTGGVGRLLRSLREHPSRTFYDEDALAVVQGYLPFARLEDQRRRAGLPPLPRPQEALP